MTIARIIKNSVEVIIFVCLLIMLVSCSYPVQMTMNDLSQHADSASMDLTTLVCPPFQLAVMAPRQAENTTLRIYIEGDGLAWRTRRNISSNPSPVKPIALLLMQEDPVHDKAYLARPCQYVVNANCDNRYWSTDRFSSTVVASMNMAVTQLKATGEYTLIELVGFSGGGAIAALIAAQRNDVCLLITVAGNLDHEVFTRLHHVSSLTGSLNPPDFAAKLEGVRQIHFIGSDDKVIPVEVFESYVHRLSSKVNVTKRVVNGVSHQIGWIRQWGYLLQQN